jgi:hypothetical protein
LRQPTKGETQKTVTTTQNVGALHSASQVLIKPNDRVSEIFDHGLQQRSFLEISNTRISILPIRHRLASSTDLQILGELNHQLIRDEGHRNRMSIPELVTRMGKWLRKGRAKTQ